MLGRSCTCNGPWALLPTERSTWDCAETLSTSRRWRWPRQSTIGTPRDPSIVDVECCISIKETYISSVRFFPTKLTIFKIRANNLVRWILIVSFLSTPCIAIVYHRRHALAKLEWELWEGKERLSVRSGRWGSGRRRDRRPEVEKMNRADVGLKVTQFIHLLFDMLNSGDYFFVMC